jgi:hypothetical protein
MLRIFLHLKVRIIIINLADGLISLATMEEKSLFHAMSSCSDENLNLLIYLLSYTA